jgi:hypothetical protein
VQKALQLRERRRSTGTVVAILLDHHGAHVTAFISRRTITDTAGRNTNPGCLRREELERLAELLARDALPPSRPKMVGRLPPLRKV